MFKSCDTKKYDFWKFQNNFKRSKIVNFHSSRLFTIFLHLFLSIYNFSLFFDFSFYSTQKNEWRVLVIRVLREKKEILRIWKIKIFFLEKKWLQPYHQMWSSLRLVGRRGSEFTFWRRKIHRPLRSKSLTSLWQLDNSRNIFWIFRFIQKVVNSTCPFFWFLVYWLFIFISRQVPVEQIPLSGTLTNSNLSMGWKSSIFHVLFQ